MKIYLAGPSAELSRVRAAAEMIEAYGHQITERWWTKVSDDGTCASDGCHDEDLLRKAARDNEAGIVAAECVIALCRSAGGISTGTAHEIGYAQALSRFRVNFVPVIVVGDPRGHLATRWSLITPVFLTVEGALFSFGRSKESG